MDESGRWRERERERGGERERGTGEEGPREWRAIALLMTLAHKAPWQAVNHGASLD